MMKKGFTLAEVLITLAIIGVVATMVLPGILTSTTEQQAKTAIKKAVNVLTNIAKMNEAIDGYDFATTNVSTKGEDHQSIYSMIIRRADVDQQKISDFEDGSLTVMDNSGATSLAPATNYVIFFRDGSFVSFGASVTGVAAAQEPQNGIRVLYDMNGTKAPNMLSNCHAPGQQVSKTSETGGDCTTRANRFIKDRFSLLLRGSQVIPNGEAARWLYNN